MTILWLQMTVSGLVIYIQLVFCKILKVINFLSKYSALTSYFLHLFYDAVSSMEGCVLQNAKWILNGDLREI
jgi:hypothetical protein